ncbi:MAG: InlB B-repeat-containing protein, partial [Bacilli bacterium]|nr:InlB B-repeat-containing protein [Bacilli bacterium]
MKKLILSLLFVLSIFIFVGCKETTYEVSFDLNYETSLLAPATQFKKEGEKATEPMEPSRDGYEFLGWFKENATKEYSFSTEVTSDFKLYAHWRELDDDEVIDYYLAGSFSNYDAADEDYAMIKGEDGKYSITVELTAENRDVTYDGHYYKVTDGTWVTCYGVDNYYIDPAPTSPTGGGLGSVWHWADGTLTVVFDAEALEITDTLVMKAPIIRAIGPAIYGKFNAWDLSEATGFHLDDDDSDGIFTGIFEFEEAGTSDFTLCVSEKWFDDQWGQRWGAGEQYKFDGTVAGMGDSTEITYEVGKYLFTYNSTSKVTTYEKYIPQETNYQISFNLNYDSSGPGPAAQTVKDGEKASLPAEPIRDGYDFLGWFKSEATSAYDFNTLVTSEFTLYAHWELITDDKYYYAGSLNSYTVDDENYTLLKGEDGKYRITVELTAANRDTAFDGHYYKVTDGTWVNSYGVDNYYIDPAPESPTGGGLGSIWHWADGTLTVTFDPDTLEISDVLVMENPIIRDIGPAIYGEFNAWDLSEATGFHLDDD